MVAQAALIELLRDPVITVDPDTSAILQANLAMCTLTGYERKVIEGLRLEALLPEGSCGAVQAAMERAQAEGDSIDPFRGSLICRDGSAIPVELVVRDVTLPGMRGLTVAARDMRRQVALEESLRSSRDQLAAILEAVGDGIIVSDVNGELVYANRAAAVSTGFTSGAAMAAAPASDTLNRFELFDENGQPISSQDIPGARMHDGDGASQSTVCYRDRDTGAERWVVISATPVCDAEGRIRQVVTALHDATAQHRQRQHDRQRARQQEVLIELGRLALQDDDLDALLNAATSLVAEALDASAAYVGELSADGTSIVIRAGYSLHNTIASYRRSGGMPAGNGSLAGYCIQLGEPVVSPDCVQETRFAVSAGQRSHGVRSAAAAPIAGYGHPYGALVVVSQEVHRFADAEERFIAGAAGIIAAAIDRARQRGELAGSEKRYRTIVETTTDGVWMLDPAGCTTFVNNRLAAMLGYTVEEMVGRPVVNFVEADEQARAFAILERRALGVAEEYEMALLTSAGDRLWVSVRANPLYDDTGLYSGALAMVTDLSLRREHDAYRYSALHDPLTGLPNRVLFEDRLTKAIEFARRESESCAVAVLDLDGFKPVNDTFGHEAGDRVLQEIAARLQRSLRQSDTAARLGGDEFGLILPATDTAGALEVAHKVRAALAAPQKINGRPVTIAASVGVAIFPQHGDDAPALTHRADMAMYLAKRERAGARLAGQGA